MIGKKIAVGMAALFLMMVCCSCDINVNVNPGENGGENGGVQTPGENIGTVNPPAEIDAEFKLEDYESLPTVQFSSINAVEESGSCKLKLEAPWTDTYSVTFSQKTVSCVLMYDAEGELLVNATEDFTIDLTKGDIVYTNIIPVKTAARIEVVAKENKSPLPFEIGKAPDPASFSTVSENPAVDPLQPAELNYVKRDNTLYVYCNAPEEIKGAPQVVNTCITREDVSDQSVYFTFEQQTSGLKDVEGFKDNGVYYGYRVTNKGEEDLYITVRNIGWQIDGKGAFLGEKEWIDFYNTKFELPDFSDFSDSQWRLYNGLYNFSGEYLVHSFQPTTYRIPAGKYMYVMGGTTIDAFGGFNVDKTADRLTSSSTCANGAVLFDVVGQAEGAYYVYNDVSKVVPGGSGYDTHMGINDPNEYGEEHTGWDVGYVVDNQATWVFNDATPAQKLPVTFTNYYSETAPSKGVPNTPVPDTTAHVQNLNSWITHIRTNETHSAVGADMTDFHTVDKDGNELIVGNNRYDSRGELPNIGNWMKDYQDVFTFVNQGDNDREITVNVTCQGAVVMLVRDMNGNRVPGTAGYSMQRTSASIFGNWEDGFDKSFRYTVKIPAHSVKQFVVEYNLMANSYGNVGHSVDLK